MPERLELSTPTDIQKILFSDTFPNSFLKQYDKVTLVVDSRTSNNRMVKEHLQNIKVKFPDKNCKVITLDINSSLKNTHFMLTLLDTMEQLGMTRRSLLVGVGGGSTGDLVGVTASVYMRGIDYCLIPTTYMSMVDGVISKVAINHGHSKNLVGVFASPKLTVVDSRIVDTHDRKAIAYGLVEMWKHALVVGEKTMLEEIDNALNKNHRFNHQELQRWALWSMGVKANFVGDDWHDKKNVHKALSLGHTLANVYEMRCNLHHAEAVAYGIIFEAIVSNKKMTLSDKNLGSILSTASKLEGYFANFDQVQKEVSGAMILRAFAKDKINHHGIFNLVLPTDEGYSVSEISDQLLSDSLTDYLGLYFDKEQSSFSRV